MPKETEREDPFGFFNIHSVAKLQNNWRGTFGGNKIMNKSRTVPKKSKGGPFGLAQYCMLRGKPFWFHSLGQQVHFGLFSKFLKNVW